MATPYNKSFNDTFPMSDTGMKVQLIAATEINWTVPGDNTDKYKASIRMTSDASVWVALNATAVVPNPGVLTATYNQEFRPTEIYVKGGDVLSFIATTGTPNVGVSLLQLPN